MSSNSMEKGDLSPATSHLKSETTSQDFSDINEAKLLRKLDLNLLPTISVLYLLSFLYVFLYVFLGTTDHRLGIEQTLVFINAGRFG